MKNQNLSYLYWLLALLPPPSPNGHSEVSEEPLTYHRRGHSFKSSITHFINGLHNELALQEHSLAA